MKNRIYPRIGAAVLAGLVAVVPVVGAVATAQPAAAVQSTVFLDEHGNEVDPVVPEGTRSPYIQPLSEDVLTVEGETSDPGLPDAPADMARSDEMPTTADIEPISEVDSGINPISEDVEIAQINAGPDLGPVLMIGVALSSLASITVVAYLLFRRRPLKQR
ncbi:hypothetical protein [Xylanimonas ulmi]|uniref:Secreted protein n=1 Tax=Xylanimonas ulmi TaxID=228973 RepID=A0A4V2EYH1_9MICO|nr:hypothetical protein [Xylanibacterium ulmi]RZS62970.1 hypothetical protein EV386_3327 [Xylanibacterium ulmi]